MVFPEPVSPTIITTLLSLITDSSWREECAVREGIYNSRGEGGGGGKGRYTLAVHVNDIANRCMSKKCPILPYPNLHVHVHLTTSTCTCTCKCRVGRVKVG